MSAQPRILVLGANFAGLTTARYVAEKVGDRAEVTVVDRKPYLTFIPNIPLEVWNDNNPEVFAVGDAAAVIVPKLGSPGHREAEIVADGLARELGATEEQPRR